MIRESAKISRCIWEALLFARFGYVPVLVTAMIIMFFRALLAARLLDISEFGLYVVGMLVSNSFSLIGCFGFYWLLQRDLPMFIAKGRRVRGSIVLRQTLILTLIVFVSFLPLSLIGLFSVSPVFFAISLLNGFAQQFFLVVSLQSRSEGQSTRFAIDNLYRAVAVLAMITLGGWITGTAFSMLLIEAVVTILVAVRVCASIYSSETIGRKVLWICATRALPRVRWGAPLTLMIMGIVSFAMQNGDRWIAASLLGIDEFALYGFAGIVMIAALSLQSVINVSLFPMLAKTYALNGNIKASRDAIRYSVIALVGAILLSVPAYYSINYATETFFPEFSLIREFLFLFLISSSLHVSNILTSYLIISKRERIVLGINVCSIGSCMAGWFLFIRLEMTEVSALSIAWLTTSIALLNFFGCLLTTVRFQKVKY